MIDDKFKAKLSDEEKTEIAVAEQFRDILHEIQAAQQAMLDPVNIRALSQAIHEEIDRAGGSSIGLSAARRADNGSIIWTVCFGIDHGMTVICSERDYSEDPVEAIATVIMACWDAEWDD